MIEDKKAHLAEINKILSLQESTRILQVHKRENIKVGRDTAGHSAEGGHSFIHLCS